MEYAYSIIMFALAAGLFLYAALVMGTKDIYLVPRHWSVKVKDTKKYAVDFAKIIMMIAGSFALSGVVGLFGITKTIVAIIAIVVAAIGLFITMVWGAKIMAKHYDE